MKELDLLKKDWKKNENSFEQISEKELYKMIHKKSSSIVRWILIISILEVLLWTFSNLFINTDDVLKKMNHPEIVLILEYLTYINYIVVLIFIFVFYKNYRTISTTVATKSLMGAILKSRTIICKSTRIFRRSLILSELKFPQKLPLFFRWRLVFLLKMPCQDCKQNQQKSLR